MSVEASLPGPLSDTVGAGDSVHGTLLSEIDRLGLSGRALSELTTETLQEVLTLASQVAGVNCTRAGCQPPTREAVEVTETVPTCSTLLTTFPDACKLLAVTLSIISTLSTVAVLTNISSALLCIWNKDPKLCPLLLGTITMFARSGARLLWTNVASSEK